MDLPHPDLIDRDLDLPDVERLALKAASALVVDNGIVDPLRDVLRGRSDILDRHDVGSVTLRCGSWSAPLSAFRRISIAQAHAMIKGVSFQISNFAAMRASRPDLFRELAMVRWSGMADVALDPRYGYELQRLPRKHDGPACSFTVQPDAMAAIALYGPVMARFVVGRELPRRLQYFQLRHPDGAVPLADAAVLGRSEIDALAEDIARRLYTLLMADAAGLDVLSLEKAARTGLLGAGA